MMSLQAGTSKASKLPASKAVPTWQPVYAATKQPQPAAATATARAAMGRQQQESRQPQSKDAVQPQPTQQGRQPGRPEQQRQQEAAARRKKPLLRANLKGQLRPAGGGDARSRDTSNKATRPQPGEDLFSTPARFC